jgi:hypothetical protein
VWSEEPDSEIIRMKNDCPDGVYIAFFEHNPWTRLSFVNKLISARMRAISPKYEHCQFVFEWNPPTSCPRATFSTTKRTPSAYLDDIAYQDKNWRAILVKSLSPEKRRLLLRWTLRNERAPFNNRGYYCNFVPPASCCSCLAFDADGEAFFCAEQIAAGMRMVGVPTFKHVRPYLCTPDAVFLLLREAGYPMLSIRMPQTFVKNKNRAPSCANEEEAEQEQPVGSLYNFDVEARKAPRRRKDQARTPIAFLSSGDCEEARPERSTSPEEGEGCCLPMLTGLFGCFCGCSLFPCCRYSEYDRQRRSQRIDQTDTSHVDKGTRDSCFKKKSRV